MNRFALFLLALCLSLPAVAERKERLGELDVHHSVFNSSFLQPTIAAANGLVRSREQGVVNIAVLKAGQAQTAAVTGTVRDLLGREQALSFNQVTEGEAIYYLAQFKFSQREVLRFTINVTGSDGVARSFTFNQEVFPDP